MKKIVLLSALLPALVFVSCNKDIEQTSSQSSQEVSARFIALAPDTKTTFGEKNSDEKYPVLWSETDKSVGYVLTTDTTVNSAELTPASDGKSAHIFVDGLASATSYQFVFVSPEASLKGANKTNQTIQLEIPPAQKSTPAGPDEAAQMLYAVTSEITSLTDEVPVFFAHASAYLHIFFKNVSLAEGATLQSVIIEAPEDCILAGRNYFLPATGKYNGEGTSQFNNVTVSTSTTDEIWCAIVPADLSDKNLKLIINTDKGTLTKTITLPANASLACGDVASFSVNMSGIETVPPVEYQLITSENDLHWGDKLIVAAADADADYAMSTGQNTNNRSQAGINRVENTILDPSSSVEIIQLEDGMIPGTWALKATITEGYLYAAGTAAGQNHLKTNTAIDATASWNISFGDVTEADKEAPDATRAIIQSLVTATTSNLIRHNPGYSIFSAYASSTTTNPVKIYRLKGDPDTTPRFKVTNESGTTDAVVVSAEASEVPVYVFGNVAWTASVNGTGASLDKTSGTGPAILTLSVPKNTGSSTVEYSVTVSTSASVATDSYSIKINQSAPVSGSIKVNDILLSETWEGGSKDATPEAYNKSANATTTVYGGAAVKYSQNGTSTKLYDDGLVYVPSNYSGTLAKPSNMMNLLVAKGSGYWSIADIPCAGVKAVRVTIHCNYGTSSYVSLTSDTANVTVGSLSASNYTSDWSKKVYVLTYDISFSSAFTGNTFDLKLTNAQNSKGSNIRVGFLEVKVTDIY